MPLSANIHIDKRSPLAPQVYEAVRSAIVCMDCKPGEAISELAIARSLGVSRSPVGEALRRLADEQLVDIFPQSGSFVAPVRLDAVMEGQFIRESLELPTVRRAATRFGLSEQRHIERILEAQRDCMDQGDDTAFYRWDEAFHQALADAAGVPNSWRLIHGSIAQLDRVRRICLPAPGRLALTVAEHEAILDGLLTRDPDEAERAMRTHLNALYANIELLLTAYGEQLFGPGGLSPALEQI